jgi:hypothetical protein
LKILYSFQYLPIFYSLYRSAPKIVFGVYKIICLSKASISKKHLHLNTVLAFPYCILFRLCCKINHSTIILHHFQTPTEYFYFQIQYFFISAIRWLFLISYTKYFINWQHTISHPNTFYTLLHWNNLELPKWTPQWCQIYPSPSLSIDS